MGSRPNPMVSKVTAFSRMDTETLRKVQDAAEKNDRSLSAELRQLVRLGLEARAQKQSANA
jgi:hypothetical protein